MWLSVSRAPAKLSLARAGAGFLLLAINAAIEELLRLHDEGLVSPLVGNIEDYIQSRKDTEGFGKGLLLE